MNSTEIYLIKDINKIIKIYKEQFDKIDFLEKDLKNFKLNFTINLYNNSLNNIYTLNMYRHSFDNIYVNLNEKEFIIIIDNYRFYTKRSFNKYFHNLQNGLKLKIFYIFINIMLKKYDILDFEEDEYLFNLFNMTVFEYIFDDYKNKTIKNNISYDYIYAYKKINNTNKINIKKILKRLEYNTKILINHNKLPKLF